jgi:DNA-binding transcriptional regulator YdaS (Cro superfamily)
MTGMKNDPLLRAAEAVGSFSELARIVGVSRQALLNWRKRQIPLERCPLIERATRGTRKPVSREELRPDIDWNLFR